MNHFVIFFKISMKLFFQNTPNVDHVAFPSVDLFNVLIIIGQIQLIYYFSNGVSQDNKNKMLKKIK